MSDAESLLAFPCEFPLKVMGRDNEEFRSQTRAIVERHVGQLDPAQVQERASREGRFVALTYTFTAQSRSQLEQIYQEMSDSGVVLFSL